VNYALQEIRDPQLNNELAVTIAVPNGWKFKKQDTPIVAWNFATYGDPARVGFILEGPKDEASWGMLSQYTFHYDHGMPPLI